VRRNPQPGIRARFGWSGAVMWCSSGEFFTEAAPCCEIHDDYVQLSRVDPTQSSPELENRYSGSEWEIKGGFGDQSEAIVACYQKDFPRASPSDNLGDDSVNRKMQSKLTMQSHPILLGLLGLVWMGPIFTLVEWRLSLYLIFSFGMRNYVACTRIRRVVDSDFIECPIPLSFFMKTGDPNGANFQIGQSICWKNGETMILRWFSLSEKTTGTNWIGQGLPLSHCGYLSHKSFKSLLRIWRNLAVIYLPIE